MEILVVIPARGGSKGIPRKNLRLLNGKPLIYYAITTALASRHEIDVYVSSDDSEILTMARTFGAKVHERDPAIADDQTTLDPVIFTCKAFAEMTEAKQYDLVITMQPTSPLLKTASLDAAIDRILADADIETVIAAKDDTHLSWRKEEGRFLPNYSKRVNRQYLTPTYTETGGFFISRADIVTPHNRIGSHVELYELRGGEEVDIDTYEDWNLCEFHLRRKHLLFVVTGNETVGLGHVYNTLLVANDILNHQITFLVDRESGLAFEKIASKNYPVLMQEHDDIIKDIKAINPDVIINDRLDTSANYMHAIKALGMTAVNFEDLGEGAPLADLVINAIYPEKQVLPNHYFGHDYFILRDEFMYAPMKAVQEDVKEVLITFGGVDPNNYTLKTICTIYDYCKTHHIKITVIAGFGYGKYDTIESFEGIEIQQNVTNISHFMQRADLIFTSAGRTTYEIASIATPAIVLVQNERELTHFFASSEFGFLNLGLGYELDDAALLKAFEDLVRNVESRKYMSALMRQNELKSGRKTVNRLLQELILKGDS